MLLEHIQERDAAARVNQAVERVLAAGRFLTPDIGGQATTTEMTAAIVEELGRIH
jgi:isocitrate/isopropylmalate dehydrogenase